jgi:PhnB protein
MPAATATAIYKPAGMQSCIPYLVLPAGQSSGLIQFLKDAFGAVELSRNLRDNGDVWHAEARIDDTTLMISDSPGATYPSVAAAHYIYVPDVDATYKLALSLGATSLSEPTDQPYGDRGAGVKDRWGNTWWLGTVIAKKS